MIDTSNIIYLKREMFHVNIRRQRNEQHFKNQRQISIKKMFENFEYLQEMSLKIREKIDKNQTLTGDELEKMVDCIHMEMRKENNLNLLDTIDAAVWMIKSADPYNYEDLVGNTIKMQQIVGDMIAFSQGYNGSEPYCQQLIIYAAKFLKYWILMEDPSINLFSANLAETIYFLINKQEPSLVKIGVDMLYNLISIDNGRLIDNLYSIKIFDQKLVKPLCNLLLSNQSQKIQSIVWEIILESFLNNDSCLINEFLSFSSETSRQSITFFEILIESSQEAEQKSLKFLKNLLRLINTLLDHCQREEQNQYEKYVQELKNSTTFIQHLEKNWLFHKWSSIANIAHDLQVHLSD